jgi:hypothetical protein
MFTDDKKKFVNDKYRVLTTAKLDATNPASWNSNETNIKYDTVTDAYNHIIKYIDEYKKSGNVLKNVYTTSLLVPSQLTKYPKHIKMFEKYQKIIESMQNAINKDYGKISEFVSNLNAMKTLVISMKEEHEKKKNDLITMPQLVQQQRLFLKIETQSKRMGIIRAKIEVIKNVFEQLLRALPSENLTYLGVQTVLQSTINFELELRKLAEITLQDLENQKLNDAISAVRKELEKRELPPGTSDVAILLSHPEIVLNFTRYIDDKNVPKTSNIVQGEMTLKQFTNLIVRYNDAKEFTKYNSNDYENTVNLHKLIFITSLSTDTPVTIDNVFYAFKAILDKFTLPLLTALYFSKIPILCRKHINPYSLLQHLENILFAQRELFISKYNEKRALNNVDFGRILDDINRVANLELPLTIIVDKLISIIVYAYCIMKQNTFENIECTITLNDIANIGFIAYSDTAISIMAPFICSIAQRCAVVTTESGKRCIIKFKPEITDDQICKFMTHLNNYTIKNEPMDAIEERKRKQAQRQQEGDIVAKKTRGTTNVFAISEPEIRVTINGTSDLAKFSTINDFDALYQSETSAFIFKIIVNSGQIPAGNVPSINILPFVSSTIISNQTRQLSTFDVYTLSKSIFNMDVFVEVWTSNFFTIRVFEANQINTTFLSIVYIFLGELMGYTLSEIMRNPKNTRENVSLFGSTADMMKKSLNNKELIIKPNDDRDLIIFCCLITHYAGTSDGFEKLYNSFVDKQYYITSIVETDLNINAYFENTPNDDFDFDINDKSAGWLGYIDGMGSWLIFNRTHFFKFSLTLEIALIKMFLDRMKPINIQLLN